MQNIAILNNVTIPGLQNQVNTIPGLNANINNLTNQLNNANNVTIPFLTLIL